VLADKKGIPPLSVMSTAANTHDMKAATETLDCIVTKRPRPKKVRTLNKDNQPSNEINLHNPRDGI
jgi:hypothetical protein